MADVLSPDNDKKNVAVLVGNGLSIAFNQDLNLQAITEEVMQRIQAADGDDVVTAMQEIAERALPQGANSADDFEVLVGAFGAESRTLGVLETLAKLTKPRDKKLRKSIKKVAKFAEQVRDAGVSHVLQVISERSHAYVDDAEHLHRLVAQITESFKGKVVFGNLNYDTLLLAALLWVCQTELADMGHGWKRVLVTVDDKEKRRVQALRENASDFPENKRVRLLHLHGSLTYWATRDAKIHAKLPKEMLEDDEQWLAVRQQTTNVRPVVVLANHRDKTDHVTKFPFSLAYEMFTETLADADHWLVIGYSFRDEPVNSMLRKQFIDRGSKPTVHVVTFGADPRRRDVERALGWGAEDGSSNAWLTIDRTGANGAEKTVGWQNFVGS
ncbi:MAG: SIR2 family protein [Leucobacter sp.]